MAKAERGSLAGGTLARLEARAAQRRASPRTDRRQALPVRRVQGEGGLDAGARVFARGTQLRGDRAHQVTPLVPRCAQKASIPLARPALPATPAAHWARAPAVDPLPSAALRPPPPSSTHPPRTPAAVWLPAEPAVPTRSPTPVPRSGVAPRPANKIAPMIATASVLASARKKFMAPVAVPT